MADPVKKLSEECLAKSPDQVFELVRRIGHGSYGSVFKAVHRQSGALYAVKQVPVENNLTEIIKEINIMAQCDCQYIVKSHGSYVKDFDLWIVMEYCDIGSISDVIKLRNKTLTEGEICCVTRDVTLGLEYLHQRSKIHRDIKAGNILLSSSGCAKLADFGVAGQLTDTLEKRNTVIGTPFWMAPEVVAAQGGGGGYNTTADIWSLGITVIEMADGQPPLAKIHPMRAMMLIPTEAPPTVKEPASWSPAFLHFLAQCLVKDPSDRATASSLLKGDWLRSAKFELERIFREIPSLREAKLAEVGQLVTQQTAEENTLDSTIVSSGTAVSVVEEQDTMVPGAGSQQGDTRERSFMRQFEEAEDARVEQVDPHNLEELRSLSSAEIQRRIEQIDSLMNQELHVLQLRYEAKREPILAALEAKRQRPTLT